jgi:hypothetical protein
LRKGLRKEGRKEERKEGINARKENLDGSKEGREALMEGRSRRKGGKRVSKEGRKEGTCGFASWSWSSNFTRSTGATRLFENVAATPLETKSRAKSFCDATTEPLGMLRLYLSTTTDRPEQSF